MILRTAAALVLGFAALGIATPVAAARPQEHASGRHPIATEWHLVASPRAPRLAVYPRPGARAPAHLLGRTTVVATGLVLLVDRVRGPWLRVRLPLRPNGSSGWVREADVLLSRTDYRIVVRLGSRRVELLRNGHVVRTLATAIGGPSTPTPPGHYYVLFSVAVQPATTGYGPFVLGFSAFSQAIEFWNGLPAMIGLHGTNAPWTIGSAASNGCLRVSNREISRLVREVPVGTPVDIVA